MFALIRHAEYNLGTGSLTPEGTGAVLRLGVALAKQDTVWKKILTSHTPRTKETAHILGEALGVAIEDDDRICMDGNFVDLLPPTEPDGFIFVSHLPVITKMLKVWSHSFEQDEPPLTEIACGYVVDPGRQTIEPIKS